MKTKGSQKKNAAKKPLAKPVSAKKAPAKKASAKKAAAPKKAPAKKAPAKKVSTASAKAQAPSKKTPAKKGSAKPAPEKRAPAKKLPLVSKAKAKAPVAASAPAKTQRAAKTVKPVAVPAPPKKIAPAPTPQVVAAKPAEPAVPRPRAVVRIAGGRARGAERPGTNGTAHLGVAGDRASGLPRTVHAASSAGSSVAMPEGKLEVNPRLESTRGKLKTPPPAAMAGQGIKGMTVAEKRRAEAEAMFLQYAKPGQPTPAPLPAPASNGAHGAGVDEYGRFSHRDSLMTMLRMSEHRSQALEAATELADRYRLPADQGLLLKVIDLGEARLTKLALEELLELDDRGRVRPNEGLRSALSRIQTEDSETRELKDLLVAKVGVRV